jgi:CheY-like chemotaxis protein
MTSIKNTVAGGCGKDGGMAEHKTVLVIEDNPLNMKLVKSLLGLGNYTMLEAEDAERGIRMAIECKPDLILMDIQLPGMDGLDATRILKAEPALKHIPVIALTSYAMDGDDKKAMKAGCDAYITKPIDTRVFLKTVEHYLQISQDTFRSMR